MSPLILTLLCIPFITNNFSRHMQSYSGWPKCITQTNYLTSGDNPAPTAHDWRPWNVRLCSGLLCSYLYKNHSNKLQPCCQKQIESIHGIELNPVLMELEWIKNSRRSRNDPSRVWKIYRTLLYELWYASNRANIKSDREVTEEFMIWGFDRGHCSHTEAIVFGPAHLGITGPTHTWIPKHLHLVSLPSTTM